MAFTWTPKRFGYGPLWITERQKSSFQFGVHTCNDALLALTSMYGSTSLSYELVIGGWGGAWSSIRKVVQSAENKVRVSTPDLMHCNETRYFWTSWEGGVIEVGRGLVVGDRMFMRWVDPDPHNVTAVGISGWNKENRWEFSHTQGEI